MADLPPRSIPLRRSCDGTPEEAVRKVRCPQCGNENTERMVLLVPSVSICGFDLCADGRLHVAKPTRPSRQRAMEVSQTVFHCSNVRPTVDGKFAPCQHEWPVPKWILDEMVW